MFKKTPEYKNTAAKISVILTLALGLFLFIMANSGSIALPWLAQLFAIASITYAVEIAVIYLLRRYTFIIEPMSEISDSGEEAYDLIINERRSNRELKVCHVSVKHIEFIRVVNSENKKTVKKERKVRTRYTYNTQFAAPRLLEIVIEGGGENASLLVSYDEELINALLSVGVRKIQ